MTSSVVIRASIARNASSRAWECESKQHKHRDEVSDYNHLQIRYNLIRLQKGTWETLMTIKQSDFQLNPAVFESYQNDHIHKLGTYELYRNTRVGGMCQLKDYSGHKLILVIIRRAQQTTVRVAARVTFCSLPSLYAFCSLMMSGKYLEQYKATSSPGDTQ